MEQTETLKEQIKREMCALNHKLHCLETLTECSIYLEERKGKYIVVRPEQMLTEDIVMFGIRISTTIFEYNAIYELSVKTAQRNLSHRLKKQGCVFLPVYVFRHSCTRLSVHSFNDQWDSGLAGFVYMTPEDLQKNNLTEDEAKAKMEYTIDMLDKNENNELYATVIMTEDETHIIESGFCGDDKATIERSIADAQQLIDCGEV